MTNTIDFTLIKQLIEEREALIESGPPERREAMRALQRHIDDTLAKAGKRNRLNTIMAMMYESLEDLQVELTRARLIWAMSGISGDGDGGSGDLGW